MQRKSPTVAGIGILIVLVAMAGFGLWNNRRGSIPLIAVPSPSASPKIVAPIPYQEEAVNRVRANLYTLCDTGASDNAVAQVRDLIAHLDVTPAPYAAKLSAVLSRALSFANPNRHDTSDTVVTFPGLPDSVICRAAAACEEHGRRKPGEIVLSFAGDCTFGSVNGDNSAIRFPALFQKSGQADYPFALMHPYFNNDDLTVVNFECTLTNATATADKQWKFKGDARYASIFPAGSVEAAGLANNHSGDYREQGFRDTVANFKAAQVPVFYQDTPYVTTFHGVEVVLIGDCTVIGENTTEIDGAPARVLAQIKRYKKPGNIVVVVMHWGSELDTVPRPWQQDLGHKFIDAGADAVVGHHPHVVQGIEQYKGRYIAYSLGNFAFGGNSLARFPETFVLQLRFASEKGAAYASELQVVPCYITSGTAKDESGVLKNNYQPIPVYGAAAEKVVALIRQRSASLKYGLRQIPGSRIDTPRIDTPHQK